MPLPIRTASDAIARRPTHQDNAAAPPRRPLAAGIGYRHFNVQGVAPRQRLLSWRDWVGNVIDVLPSRAQLEQPFGASIDCYKAGNLVFTDCRSDLMQLERSQARISTDNVRDFAFQVFLEGGADSINGAQPGRGGSRSGGSILALDMNQPLRMQRSNCRVLSFFVPRATMESIVPDADALHCRMVDQTSPLARMVIAHAAALSQDLPGMQANELEQALEVNIQLLGAAFGKEARLSGDARAATRAAAFSEVRRYIRANVHQASLTADSLLGTLNISRASLYRMFEHEGGIVAYIRKCRLREAADELVRYPQMAVMDIAYGLGFSNGSDFTRAFRSLYGMTPQDFRMQAQRYRSMFGENDTPFPALATD